MEVPKCRNGHLPIHIVCSCRPDTRSATCAVRAHGQLSASRMPCATCVRDDERTNGYSWQQSDGSRWAEGPGGLIIRCSQGGCREWRQPGPWEYSPRLMRFNALGAGNEVRVHNVIAHTRGNDRSRLWWGYMRKSATSILALMLRKDTGMNSIAEMMEALCIGGAILTDTALRRVC